MTEQENVIHGRDKELESDDPMELVMHCVEGSDPVAMAVIRVSPALLGGGAVLQLINERVRMKTMPRTYSRPRLPSILGPLLLITIWGME